MMGADALLITFAIVALVRAWWLGFVNDDIPRATWWMAQACALLLALVISMLRDLAGALMVFTRILKALA